MVGAARGILLQVRSQQGAREHEQQCVLRSTALEAGQLAFYDLIARPAISWADVADFDFVYIGGAGDHSVTEEHDFSASLREVVQRLVDENRPLVGGCFGHHFVAQALGAEVVTDAAREEIGTFDIELTEAGREDPLFEGLPAAFPAQLGHHDRVSALPSGLVELAYSRNCRNQVFRVAGKPVYGMQFHPEMTDRDLYERLLMYSDSYLAEPEGADKLARNVRPTPETYGLLRRFLKLFAGQPVG